MFSVQKLLNFENLVQEVEEERVVVGEEWPSKGRIEFKDVMMRYRPDTETVLNRLSFKVEPGMKVGVVGRTGAGKSTLALTLSRILEVEQGSIEIDGVNIG